MKPGCEWLALFTLILGCAELRAQLVLVPPPPPPYPYSGGAYVSGGGIGITYQRGRLALGGFIGGRSVMAGPIIAPPYSSPPPTRVTINNYGPSTAPPKPSLEDELAGVDLDLVPAKKKAAEPVAPPRRLEPLPPEPKPPEPEPQFKLPGVEVSRPKNVLRPEDLPKKPPQDKVPPPPQPEQKEVPKAPHLRLVEEGLAAFKEQQFGLAALRFEQAAQARPDFAQAHFLLAQAQFALGKYPQAVGSIHAGLKLDKHWPRADFRPRQQLYQGQEAELDAELKQLHEVLAKQPMQPTLLFLSGYQLWFDGRRPDALARFRLAREVTADQTYIDLFLAAAPALVVQK